MRRPIKAPAPLTNIIAYELKYRPTMPKPIALRREVLEKDCDIQTWARNKHGHWTKVVDLIPDFSEFDPNFTYKHVVMFFDDREWLIGNVHFDLRDFMNGVNANKEKMRENRDKNDKLMNEIV